MTDLLVVKDLSVAFDVHRSCVSAVHGASFAVPRGKTVALVGESGSGKSVTAQAIMGILPRSARITGGEILFNDPELGPDPVDIVALSRKRRDRLRAIRGGRISIIFQEPMTSLSPLHTLGNQVSEALFLHRSVGRKEGRELTLDMLRLVGFPDPARAYDTFPFELSGGLRQRGMIAMALVCRPALLIADEPTTALDVTIQAQILQLLNTLQAELHMAVLMITHDLGVVANMADEVVVMWRGQVMESGPVAEIFERPGHPYLQALMRAVPRIGHPRSERLVPLREIQPETGHLLAETAPWPQGAPATLLAIRDVSKTFAIRKQQGWLNRAPAERHQAVDQVSLAIERGECLGLVGESGCGKTTLSKLIMRALTPDAGEIRYNNRGDWVDVHALTGRALFDYRARVQYIFQDPFSSLNPRMTVGEILAEPLAIHKVGDRGYRREMVHELMRLVGLEVAHLSRFPHSFSGGQRQRIGIARALALRPDLIICDEPVSALDVSIQAQILNLLRDLKDRLGLTLMFVSHNLAVVDYLADRIAVMCAGRIVEIAPRERLFAAPRHPYTQALLAAVPEPDLDRRLDFSALREGRASEPAAWPAPFTIDGDRRPDLVTIGNGHLVRATEVPA